ncbi:alcohol oxidase-like protein [Trametes meyenii]|nr:alcohol oxidase-like protein [Trametes meyenii]
MPALTSSETEYDIIFAGGGTSAGVAAGRLAAAAPDLRILIVEAGPHTQEDLAHVQPARCFSHLTPDTITAKHIVGRPSDHLNGRPLVIQTGQCVGGGSSMNFVMYTRPPRSDYDDWEKVYKNPGWGFDDLLPLIKKTENFQAIGGAPRQTHGYKGPLKVSYGGYRSSVAIDYLTTMAEYDKTRPIVDDANSMINDINHFQPWPKWIDQETGRRADVPHNFLYDKTPRNSNLQIVVGCTVKRIIIEDGKAVGVEYVHNPRITPTADNAPRVARAKDLVVVSAGAFGSPAILERSGIGARDIIERFGLELVVDLPGVGENYNDHPVVFVPFLAAEGTETLDGIIRNDEAEIAKWSAQWLKDGTGMMASNGVDAGCKYRPNPEELKNIGPDFAKRWESFFVPSPDKAIVSLGVMSLYLGVTPPPSGTKCFCVGGFMYYPSGIGSIHITSADDVEAPPDFDTGVLSSRDDLAVLRHVYKRTREFARRMSTYRGEYAPDHPEFPKGSAAAIPEGPVMPVPIDAPEIVYTTQDDEAIDDLIRSRGGCFSSWPPQGPDV